MWLPGSLCALLQLGAFGRARRVVLGALPARSALISKPRVSQACRRQGHGAVVRGCPAKPCSVDGVRDVPGGGSWPHVLASSRQWAAASRWFYAVRPYKPCTGQQRCVRYVPAARAAVVQAGVPCGSECLHSLLGHAELPEHAAACCVYMSPLVAGPYAGSHWLYTASQLQPCPPSTSMPVQNHVHDCVCTATHTKLSVLLA